MQVVDIVRRSKLANGGAFSNRSQSAGPRKSRRFLLVSLFFVLVGVVFGYVTTRADVVNFYPGSCLGEWENVSRAQGKPDSTQGGIEEGTSAIARNIGSEIYCGGFEGSIPQDAEPKKFLLKLAWATLQTVSSEDAAPPVNGTDAGTTQTSNATSTDIELHPTVQHTQEATTTHEATVDDQTSQVQASEPAKDSAPSQDVPVEPAQQDQVPTVQKNPETSFLQLLIPEVFAQDAELVSSSTRLSTDVGTSSHDMGAETEDALVEILYTLDSSSWQTLGTVSKSHIASSVFSLPLTKWSDLSKVQIKIRNAKTMGDGMVVALDGMWIEVEYEDKSADPNPQPNFKTESIVQERGGQGVRVVQVRHSGLLFDTDRIWYMPVQASVSTSTPEVWSLAASDDLIDHASPIETRDSYIFWLGKNKRTLWSFNMHTGSYSSVSINPGEETAALIFENMASEHWRVIYTIAQDAFSYERIQSVDSFDDAAH